MRIFIGIVAIVLIGITAFDRPAIAQGKTFSQIPAASAPPGASDSIIGIQSAHDARFSLGQLQATMVPFTICPLCGGPPSGRLIGPAGTPDWLSTYAYGTNKTPIISESTVGEVAITGASRSSDLPFAPGAAVGLMGWGMNDLTTFNKYVWSIYGEARRYPNALGGATGIEVDATEFQTGANHKAITSYDIYQTGAVMAGWFVSGGSCLAATPCYNPANGLKDLVAQPASLGIGIAGGAVGFDRGLVIGRDALTGMDGNTGTGVAMEMPKGATLQWMYCANTTSYPTNCGNGTDGAEILSTVSSNTDAMRLNFTNSGLAVENLAGSVQSALIGGAGSSFVPPGFGGTFLTNSLFTSTYAATHGADARTSLVVNRTAVGSGTNGPADSDAAQYVTASKTDYLSSTVDGEVDGLYVVTAQGSKGDSGGILVNSSKVRGGTAGVAAYETSGRWIDSSANVLMDIHTLASFGEATGGQSSNTGYGLYTEDWGAAHSVAASQVDPFAGLYIGAYDPNGNCTAHCPNFTNAIVAAGSRAAAHIYFKVTGGVNEAGDIVMGSSSATGADGAATQSGGTPITLGNHGGLLTISSNINVPTSTPASQTATCTTGTITWDTGFIYVCTGTDHWRRAALSNTAF